jgi:hypothetical protein
MKFYEFRQNNSGGSFAVDDNVAHSVYIEAEDADRANEIALEKGLYFNGVDTGQDCNCCGDRWYPTDDDEYNIIEVVNSHEIFSYAYEKVEKGIFGDKAFIHFLDGSKTKVER